MEVRPVGFPQFPGSDSMLRNPLERQEEKDAKKAQGPTRTMREENDYDIDLVVSHHSPSPAIQRGSAAGTCGGPSCDPEHCHTQFGMTCDDCE